MLKQAAQGMIEEPYEGTSTILASDNPSLLCQPSTAAFAAHLASTAMPTLRNRELAPASRLDLYADGAAAVPICHGAAWGGR